MPSASKNKGSGFEREVAKFLTEQYAATFTRAPGSGAFTGGKNSYRRTTLAANQVRTFKGDIMPPEGFDRFNAECKFYNDFQFHQLLTECAQLETWLAQLMAAADTDDLSILFFKINRRGRFVAVQASIPWKQDKNYFTYTSTKYGCWMIYSFENFFKLNSDLVKTKSKL